MNTNKEAQDLIDSGDLELYVMGQLSDKEESHIRAMAERYPLVAEEIQAISIALEQYATQQARAPHAATKPFVMATLNFMARIQAGENPSNPPIITEHTSIADYQQWLHRPDLQLTQELKDAYAHIIGYTPQAITAIVWLAQGAMPESHHDEHEKFLVVEGTCCVTIEGVEHHLVPGNTISIPLYAQHHIQVTSAIPCKVILQRVAVAA